MSVGVAIVGCGAIGRKRAEALGHARLVACADVRLDRAQSLAAGAPGALSTADWKQAVEHPQVDVVVVATTNDQLAPVASQALAAGRHVLVEKPAARTVAEIETVQALAIRHRRHVRVGFNHRYHPGLQQARTLVDAGVTGPLLFVRARYGHGGRLGYDREWRADPSRSGGGELIDQGVHVIDLARWFLGDFSRVDGRAHTYYWQMPVDDNAFLLLETAAGRSAFLHVSCTEWKNLFSFEIYGRNAKIHVEGLGGSYGTERVALYRMLPEMGPPETTIWEYPRADVSWQLEFNEFLEDVRLDRPPAASLADARAALAVVERVYAMSEPATASLSVGGAA
ncbi:MAG: Gfo/Idh/MocA family protein [Vicinamibacterales bacterium]